MLQQRTLKHEIRATGVGLHTGEKVFLTLRPAAPDTGIVFRRDDLESPLDIPARAENVGDTRLSTTLAKDGVRISTVEHLLSALHACGVTNMLVKVHGEIPVLDGSALSFLEHLEKVGIADQDAPVKELVEVAAERNNHLVARVDSLRKLDIEAHSLQGIRKEASGLGQGQ